MRHMNIREAKAGFSALVDAVERGKTVTITKHGKPAVVIIPLELAAQIVPQKPNFAEFLMSVPTDFGIRSRSFCGLAQLEQMIPTNNIDFVDQLLRTR